MNLRARSLVQQCSISQNLLGHDTGSHNRKSETSREMAASTGVLAVIPLERSSKVCMTRPRHSCKDLIIRRVRILIAEHDRQGRACGMTLEKSADYARLICLDTRGRSLRTAFASAYILSKIILTELQTGRDSIQHHTYEFTM